MVSKTPIRRVRVIVQVIEANGKASLSQGRQVMVEAINDVQASRLAVQTARSFSRHLTVMGIERVEDTKARPIR